MSLYRNLRAGDRVTFRDRFGKLHTGKVQGLLIFQSHVVLNMGGKYGTPQVVNDSNFVGVASRAVSTAAQTPADRGHRSP